MHTNESQQTPPLKACEVCFRNELTNVINLGNHPLCDDLLPIGSEDVCVEHPLIISFCPHCRTAHQTHQIAKQLLFPRSYHYRARHTADVLNGMKLFVEESEKQYGELDNAFVLDIGCNDGSLLSIYKRRGAKTVGVEPTDAASDAITGGHIVYQDYFTPALAENIVAVHGHPDIITFTNVFAHIEDLPSLLKSVQKLMSRATLLIIENHYLGSVLDRHQFDTFYHEHPRTYSLTSFTYIAKSLNAEIVSVGFPSRYGGNIRVMLKLASDARLREAASNVIALENNFQIRLAALAETIPIWVSVKRARLQRLAKIHGPLIAKAFPGRAAILVKLLQLDENIISAAYEKPGSMKIGHYIPGTRIPIKSDADLMSHQKNESPIINFAWHISQEVHTYLRQMGCNAEIIDIFSIDEFNNANIALT